MTDMVFPIQAAHDAKDAVVAAAEAKKRFEEDVWVEGFAGDFVVAALDAALPHLRTLFETATQLGRAIGRQEALDEVQAALIAEGATQRALAIVHEVSTKEHQP